MIKVPKTPPSLRLRSCNDCGGGKFSTCRLGLPGKFSTCRHQAVNLGTLSQMAKFDKTTGGQSCSFPGVWQRGKVRHFLKSPEERRCARTFLFTIGLGSLARIH